MPWSVRRYQPDREPEWLRCRTHAFADTAYFDDVLDRKPRFDVGVELVADDGGDLVGILDASIEGSRATIETLAVLPAHRGIGIAAALWERASTLLAERGARTVEAWTREDEAANAWYRAQGFAVGSTHLQVLDPETSTWFDAADLSREPDLRRRYERVHRCRGYHRPLPVAK